MFCRGEAGPERSRERRLVLRGFEWLRYTMEVASVLEISACNGVRGLSTNQEIKGPAFLVSNELRDSGPGTACYGEKGFVIPPTLV